MYVEISGRQTGKTSRLIRELEYHLSNPNNYACLVTHKMSWGLDLTRKMKTEYRDRVFFGTEIDMIVATARKKNLDPLTNNFRWFWDEFDFCRPNNVVIMDTGYYATTPKFIRKFEDWELWYDDPLLCLVVANDFMYTSRHGMACFDADVEKMSKALKSLGAEKFNIEFLSGFDRFEEDADPVDDDGKPNRLPKLIMAMIQ